MQVNDHGQNGSIIYPQNLKKFTGYVEEIQSKKIDIRSFHLGQGLSHLTSNLVNVFCQDKRLKRN